jgi:hypothetical protein
VFERTEIMKIGLNIFTNCASCAPDTEILERTYDSFKNVFGEYETRIFIDPHTRTSVYREYFQRISKLFPLIECVKSMSLSDGYIKSIQMSDADYLFQLEHDWIFKKEHIKHTIEQICDLMHSRGLYHFRFNKRENMTAIWDKTLWQVESSDIKYCITPNLSNNPHIIDRLQYSNHIIKYIKNKTGSKGIEEELNLTGKFFSCIYGELGYPACVNHLDGRRKK